MKNLQETLNAHWSLPIASLKTQVSYRRLQLAIQRGELKSLMLPGGHRAVWPQDAIDYAESLSK